MNKPSSRTITLTVGTAGHIDHGKTELVKYLTGCNTDVLPEEKERGMTINIGFATCELPDNRRVGIVDVPGHERFIHNMVAGAAGIDVVMLVVAADDGVMPQTIEHFHIVRMLGVSSGMVVITKSDLVEESRIEEVRQEVVSLVRNSFLEGCPIVAFSSRTGAGFDEFHSAFVSVVNKTAERNADGPFRMHVERAFILEGLGTIISGIPCSGRVRMGDELELLPSGRKTKVRGIQVYGVDSGEALSGECVALRMSDIAKINPGRGMVLAEQGFFAPSKFINARFQCLPHVVVPLKPRTAVRFHVGTADVSGHMVLPELKELRPGEESYVQFQLNSPVVAAPGDFFIARLLSPAVTIGGGYVVASVDAKLRRSSGDWQKECVEREEAFRKPETALDYVVANAGPEPLTLRQTAHMAFMNEEAAGKYIEPMVKAKTLIMLPGGRYVSCANLALAAGEIINVLNRLHDLKPVSTGFPKKDVFLMLRSNRAILDRALEDLKEKGTVISSEAGLALKERATELSPGQAKVAGKIEKIYIDGGYSSPRTDELPALVGVPDGLIKPVLERMVQTGTIILTEEKIAFHRDHIASAMDQLVEYITEHGSIESGVFRDMLGTTRKYSIPLLEYFDRTGLTVRKDNIRVLRSKNK